MTDYILEIRLQSPLTSAAGEGRVGLVDRDIAFDEFGLPILPGRRLKGLWRDAYRDVADAWQRCGQNPIPVAQIFGDAGQSPNDGDACIYVANAELEDASSIKQWLKYLQHHKVRKLHVDDVVGYYASVRAQTSIDRQTGSAKEDTLRLTRTLRSDLIFWAPIHFTESPDAALQNALALGAVALRHMGTARTRGLGKIRCRLLKLDTSGKPQDLTPVLSQNHLPSITRPASSQSTQVSGNQAIVVPRSALGIPTHMLRYRLKLTAAVVIPGSEEDPNTVVTRQDIPGSNILGIAAWHYLKQANHTAGDPAFRHAFLDGGLRFLTAYPETVDTQQRMLPIPHSIRKFKDTEGLLDLVEQTLGKQATKRLNRQHARVSQGQLATQSVKTERNYHHARASKDRRIGRALGAEVPNGGALFTYEAIRSGQTFQGAVLGTECDLTNLKTWLQGIKTVSIGRSRSAQYGTAEFEIIDDAPQELDKLVEWDGFNPQQAPPISNKSLIITTLSPLLTVNNNGHPNAHFPEKEMAEALGLNASELTLSSSYTRTELVGGYHAHLRLPRQQWPAIAAGSVFVFKLAQKLTKEKLLQLEHDGLGIRKAEGYGRLAINRQGSLNLLQTEEEPLDDPEKASSPTVPDVDISSDLLKLLQGVVQVRCAGEMQRYARDIARQLAERNRIPSNALLGRLRLFLRQNAPDESLQRLRKPAKDQLTNFRIDMRDFDMPELPNQLTLFDLFKNAWTQPDLLTKNLITSFVENLAEDCDEDVGEAMIETLVDNYSAKLRTEFLDYLLTALRRRLRT